MGHAIDALDDGVSNVIDNPILVAIAYVVTLVTAPVLVVVGGLGLVLSFIPLIGPLIAQLLFAVTVKPLLIGGVLGPSGKAFAEEVELRDALDGIKDNFVSLAGAFALYEVIRLAISFVFGILLLVLFFVTGFGMSAAGDPTAAMTGMGVLLVVGYVLALVAILAVAILLQFVDAAVVLGDQDIMDAFKQSVGFAKDAPVSVLGYSVLRALLGLIIVLPGYVIIFGGGHFVDALTWVGAFVTLLLYPLAFVVLMSYHAAYYGYRLRAN